MYLRWKRPKIRTKVQAYAKIPDEKDSRVEVSKTVYRLVETGPEFSYNVVRVDQATSTRSLQAHFGHENGLFQALRAAEKLYGQPHITVHNGDTPDDTIIDNCVNIIRVYATWCDDPWDRGYFIDTVPGDVSVLFKGDRDELDYPDSIEVIALDQFQHPRTVVLRAETPEPIWVDRLEGYHMWYEVVV